MDLKSWLRGPAFPGIVYTVQNVGVSRTNLELLRGASEAGSGLKKPCTYKNRDMWRKTTNQRQLESQQRKHCFLKMSVLFYFSVLQYDVPAYKLHEGHQR